MNRTYKIAMLLAAACLLALVGCKKSEDDAARKTDEAAQVGTVTVDQLAAALDKGACAALDANGTETRTEIGTIPGATLLSHYTEYKLDELPGDKATQLVFYCMNEACGASHAAAKRAYLAGYTNVNVLPAGIEGWKKAGQKVQTVQ